MDSRRVRGTTEHFPVGAPRGGRRCCCHDVFRRRFPDRDTTHDMPDIPDMTYSATRTLT